MALLLISLCQFFHDTFFRFCRSTATSQLKMTFFLPALTLIIASPFISSVGSNIGKSHLSLSLSLSPVLSIDGDWWILDIDIWDDGGGKQKGKKQALSTWYYCWAVYITLKPNSHKKNPRNLQKMMADWTVALDRVRNLLYPHTNLACKPKLVFSKPLVGNTISSTIFTKKSRVVKNRQDQISRWIK